MRRGKFLLRKLRAHSIIRIIIGQNLGFEDSVASGFPPNKTSVFVFFQTRIPNHIPGVNSYPNFAFYVYGGTLASTHTDIAKDTTNLTLICQITQILLQHIYQVVQ